MTLNNVNVATLDETQVQVIQKYEQEFKAKYGNNVILIAFHDKQQ